MTAASDSPSSLRMRSVVSRVRALLSPASPEVWSRKPGDIWGNALPKVESGEREFTETIRQDEAPSTGEGTIVGTVSYMSPEQAEGKKVDARSDIFAFGCVVYEMVTGKRCFDGKTKASLIGAVLALALRPSEMSV